MSLTHAYFLFLGAIALRWDLAVLVRVLWRNRTERIYTFNIYICHIYVYIYGKIEIVSHDYGGQGIIIHDLQAGEPGKEGEVGWR